MIRYFDCFGYNGYCGDEVTSGFNGMNYFGSGIMWLIGIGIVIVIALIIYALVHNNKKKATLDNDIEERLKIRYINGEISHEEYEKMKRNIR